MVKGKNTMCDVACGEKTSTQWISETVAFIVILEIESTNEKPVETYLGHN